MFLAALATLGIVLNYEPVGLLTVNEHRSW
jgi:hypothetical protein